MLLGLEAPKDLDAMFSKTGLAVKWENSLMLTSVLKFYHGKHKVHLGKPSLMLLASSQ